MFNYDVSDSFFVYLNEVNPDLAIIQECRYNRLENLPAQYEIFLPNHFTEEKVDNRIHFTLILSKDENSHREDIEELNKFDYSFLKMVRENNSLLAIHLPYRGNGDEDAFDKLLLAIRDSKADIICGDFNASSKKPNENYKFICDLIDNDNYINLWEEGMKEGIAKVIDYHGKPQKAKSGIFYRTYAGNTHIDYALAKKDECILKSIAIDNRTLAFTDHCGIIVDVDIV